MKIVIASDSFKGSLSSTEVAQAARRGIKAVYPDCEVVAVNVADGGEGTVEAIVEALGGDYCIYAQNHCKQSGYQCRNRERKEQTDIIGGNYRE